MGVGDRNRWVLVGEIGDIESCVDMIDKPKNDSNIFIVQLMSYKYKWRSL